MFSRYKKAGTATAHKVAYPAAKSAPKTANSAKPSENPAAHTAAPKEASKQPMRLRKAVPTSPAQAVASDKDRKRKERLQDIKVELHRELLENLNLSALESA